MATTKNRKIKKTISVELPQWDDDFILKSKKYTRRINFFRVIDTLALLCMPSVLSILPMIDGWYGQTQYLAIIVFLVGLASVSIVRQVFWFILVAKRSHFLGNLLRQVGKIGIWCTLCLWWYALSDTNIFFVILGWWICCIPFVGYLWLVRRWDLKGAKLVKNNYRLAGLKRLPSGSRKQKLGSLKLYELPEDSPLGNYSAQATVARKPSVYIGASMMEYLTPNQLNAVVAHELGHSLSTDKMPFQIGRWGWRLFGLPIILWLVQLLPSSLKPWLSEGTVSQFLTITIAGWLVSNWIAILLDRQIELGADLFALRLATGAQDFVDGMGKMARKVPYNVFPNLFDWLGFNSHPSVVSRMRKLQQARDK